MIGITPAKGPEQWAGGDGFANGNSVQPDHRAVANPGKFCLGDITEMLGQGRWPATADGAVEMVADNRNKNKERQKIIGKIEHRYSFGAGEAAAAPSRFNSDASNRALRVTMPKAHRLSLTK
jgi:hypothetical protein